MSEGGGAVRGNHIVILIIFYEKIVAPENNCLNIIYYYNKSYTLQLESFRTFILLADIVIDLRYIRHNLFFGYQNKTQFG